MSAPTPEMMTGGEAVVRTLVSNKVSRLFALPAFRTTGCSMRSMTIATK